MPKFSMPELPPVFADLQKKVADVMASGPAAEVEKHMKQALSVALSKRLSTNGSNSRVSAACGRYLVWVLGDSAD